MSMHSLYDLIKENAADDTDLTDQMKLVRKCKILERALSDAFMELGKNDRDYIVSDARAYAKALSVEHQQNKEAFQIAMRGEL